MISDGEASWEILVRESTSVENSFHLTKGSLLFGTSPDCAIVTTANGVAPRQAEFIAGLGTLRMRILTETPPILLNGAPVLGLVDVPCPATVQIGSLQIYIKEAAATGLTKTNANSTLRIIHPARTEFGPLTDPENLDITGRIVFHLPGKENTARREESTMAFSMEDPEISISDKVPVRMDYEVKGEIARGGMGRIFSAEDPALERQVALKVSTVGDPARDTQFFREAKILAALSHPNIVPIHSVGADSGGRPFYSMKLIQGRTLQRIIKQLDWSGPKKLDS
jgi:hypothetical protein